jgi:hypothetical protein
MSRIFDFFIQNLTNYYNYLLLKSGSFKQYYQIRKQVSLNQVFSKYLNNYKSINLPFNKALPLVKYEHNPILKAGNPGDWDESGIFEPFFLFDGSKFFCYYESETKSKKKDWQIGVATASKITGPWKKYSKNPILSYTGIEGDYDMQCIADPSVIYRNSTYEMWYDMFDGEIWRIGKATSNDGLNWNKIKKLGKTAISIDIGEAGKWDDEMVHCPEVYLWQDNVHVIYGAQGEGHFEYDSGLAIQEDENAEKLKKWGQVTNDGMLGNDKIISRMQAGININGIIIAGLRIKLRLNETTYLIYSDDGGKMWVKLSDPILRCGKKGDWDQTLYYGPNCWITSENKLWTGYLGSIGGNPKRELGIASMDIPEIF